jgi:hypothetical protein
VDQKAKINMILGVLPDIAHLALEKDGHAGHS